MACLHDEHIVIIFEAENLLQKRKIKVKGNGRLIFQNSEETFTSVKVISKFVL
jgi:metal-dependent amidase/aminoacylase/carboxypeptidase family protein